MSYTPTEWKNGDIITAEKMNNIEQGIQNAQNVAVVKILMNPETPTSMSWGVIVGYSDGMTPYNALSINRAVLNYDFGGYNSSPYIMVPLPMGDDKAVIIFNTDMWGGYTKTTTGDISDPVDCLIRYNATSWISQDYFGFIVEGNGTITLQYED